MSYSTLSACLTHHLKGWGSWPLSQWNFRIILILRRKFSSQWETGKLSRNQFWIIRRIRIFLLDTTQWNKPFSQKSCLDTCSLRQRLKVWHLHQNFSSMRSCLKGDKMHQNGNAQEKHDSTYSHIQMLNQHLQKCCRHRIVDIPIDCQPEIQTVASGT